LVESKSFANLDYSTNEWMNSGNPYDDRYHNQFTYNANGGMLTALAKNALGETIDNQTYHRPTVGGRYVNNRTYAITDAATQTSGEDLLDQQAFDNTVLSNNNYDFTEIGERNKDNASEIELITWNVYGKKVAIKRTPGSSKNNVKFDYDATNNRIAKHVYTSDDIWINSEYYVHDAQGNLMATYRLEASSGSGLSYELTERHIYGSSSIGINTTPVEMIGATTQEENWEHILGDKRYNGSNHLGNVLSVFTDKKIPLDTDNNGIIDGYLPQVISANDYAPFGSRLAERTFNKELYPNSFNGKREAAELDGEQDYGERDYNPKEREFDKTDPFKAIYTPISPYSYGLNNPILNIDVEGNFVIEGTEQEKAMLRKFVEAAEKALATNPYLLDRLLLHSGLTEDELDYFLQKGKVLY
jgi:RHS repeat-associated protein